MACFDSLPNETLYSLFLFCRASDLICAARLVCKRWCSLLTDSLFADWLSYRKPGPEPPAFLSRQQWAFAFDHAISTTSLGDAQVGRHNGLWHALLRVCKTGLPSGANDGDSIDGNAVNAAFDPVVQAFQVGATDVCVMFIRAGWPVQLSLFAERDEWTSKFLSANDRAAIFVMLSGSTLNSFAKTRRWFAEYARATGLLEQDAQKEEGDPVATPVFLLLLRLLMNPDYADAHAVLNAAATLPPHLDAAFRALLRHSSNMNRTPTTYDLPHRLANVTALDFNKFHDFRRTLMFASTSHDLQTKLTTQQREALNCAEQAHAHGVIRSLLCRVPPPGPAALVAFVRFEGLKLVVGLEHSGGNMFDPGNPGCGTCEKRPRLSERDASEKIAGASEASLRLVQVSLDFDDASFDPLLLSGTTPVTKEDAYEQMQRFCKRHFNADDAVIRAGNRPPDTPCDAPLHSIYVTEIRTSETRRFIHRGPAIVVYNRTKTQAEELRRLLLEQRLYTGAVPTARALTTSWDDVISFEAVYELSDASLRSADAFAPQGLLFEKTCRCFHYQGKWRWDDSMVDPP